MGSYRQTLLDGLATFEALLRGEARVHSNHLMTSSCSLFTQDVEECTPTGVHDALRQGMVLCHVARLKLLNSNHLVLPGVLFGRFEEVFLILMQIRIFAVLPQLDGMPAVGLLETREAYTRDAMLLGGKKAFERRTQTISQHLNGGGRNMCALSLESRFQVILAWEGAFSSY